MKINELIGAKNTPAFKAAQAFDMDKSDEDDYSKERTNLTAELAKLGWTPIGKGWYSAVYQHPSYNYVLKVFSHHNKLWMEYFNYALKHQDNPHVPKIRGKLVKLSPNAYAVRMEKLAPVTNEILMKYIDPYWKHISYETGRLTHFNNRPGYMSDLFDVIFTDENNKFLRRNWPRLVQLYNDIWQEIAHKNGDFDGYQFMARGNILVWIDPV